MENIKIIPLLDTLKLQKIDDNVYFSDTYKDYISNSRLSLLKKDDPEPFFEGFGKHTIYSDSLLLGSVVHQLTLQPELYELVMDINRPTAKMGFVADELYNDWISRTFSTESIIKASNKIDYYKGKMTDDKIQNIKNKCEYYWKARELYEIQRKSKLIPIYLDPKNREKAIKCIDALQSNKRIQELLHPKGIIINPESENEQAILLDVEIHVPNYNPFIFKLKAKLDNYTIDYESNTVTINDIKTIGKILSEFENNFNSYAYYRELSIYSWLMSLIAKKYYNMENCIIKSNCLVVSTIPNYYTKVYQVSKNDFNRGWNEFKYLLKLAAHFYTMGYRFL